MKLCFRTKWPIMLFVFQRQNDKLGSRRLWSPLITAKHRLSLNLINSIIPTSSHWIPQGPIQLPGQVTLTVVDQIYICPALLPTTSKYDKTTSSSIFLISTFQKCCYLHVCTRTEHYLESPPVANKSNKDLPLGISISQKYLTTEISVQTNKSHKTVTGSVGPCLWHHFSSMQYSNEDSNEIER